MSVSFGTKQNINFQKSSESGVTGSAFNAYANVSKFGVKAEEYTKGTLKGGIYGAGASGAVLALAKLAGKVSEGKGFGHIVSRSFAKPFELLSETREWLDDLTSKNIIGAVGQIIAWPVPFAKRIAHSSAKTGTKILAGAAGIAGLSYGIVKAKIAVNQRTATIDHKYKVGHRTR